MPGFEIFGKEEQIEVGHVLETGVLFRYGFDGPRKGYWKAKTFESEFSQKMGTAHCHLCSSGTSALNIALAACGIGAGDEVIIPPFTFVASMEAVILAGAVPIFADIDETLCLSPKAVESAITERTRAVIPVHMCGSMADIEQIKDICQKKDLILVEDACQSVGAAYKGRYLGTFGHMGCFSFDPVKTITCGEGGAIITNDKDLYLKADAYADHGHDHIGNDRGLEGHEILGANYRISELNAAVGLAQLRKLDYILQTQRANKKNIKDALSKCSEISFRKLPDESGDSATFLSFFLPDESKARNAAKELAKAGVDGCFYWYDNNWHYIRQWHHLKQLKGAAKLPLQLLDKLPDYSKINLLDSDSIMGRTISMQIKLSWTESDIEDRIKKMMHVFQ